MRLWSLADGSCLRTFEGHLASVLRLDFLSAGGLPGNVKLCNKDPLRGWVASELRSRGGNDGLCFATSFRMS